MRVLAENQNLSQDLQVPALEEVITSNECISQDVPTEEVDLLSAEDEIYHLTFKVRQEPYSLPDGFKWDTLLLDDPLVLKEVGRPN